MRRIISDGQTILVRADGDPAVGTGHVMRCLALAQAWRRSGGSAYFAAARLTPSLKRRLLREEIEVRKIKGAIGKHADVKQTIDLAKKTGASWIVVDGYNFGAAYQKAIKAAGLRLLLIDDYGHAEHYWADYVLNQNLSVDPRVYEQRESSTRLLLGPRYALLRTEFVPWRQWKRKVAKRARNILITLGGSDPKNVTGEVLRMLVNDGIDKPQIVAVIGGSNPHRKKLQAAANHYKSIHLVFDTPNMPELMARADVAVAAGGTTAWELAFMGLPALVFVLADNQRTIAAQLETAGLARNLGAYTQASSKNLSRAIKNLLGSLTKRVAMSRTGRKIVDGLGSDRVCLRLRKMLDFRPVTFADCKLIWRWANEPTVRAVSFSSKPIPWKDHVSWFSATLNNPRRHFWVALGERGKALGQVRFDVNRRRATMSVGLDRLHRGKDLGALMIWTACEKLLREIPQAIIYAYIKPDNEVSIRAFAKAGFERVGKTTIKGCDALAFRLTREQVEK